MDNNEEISNIAKKRVLEKEKQNQYDQVREKIQQITDFNGQIHEDPDKNTVEQVEDSDIVKELSELQEMQDIQTIKPIETSRRGFARPIALWLRGNIQNEVRFALDPIVEKQVRFNSKILNLINNLNTKHQELINNLSNATTEHKKLIEQLGDTSVKHQQLMDQLSSTSAKHQELIDQLSSTSVKPQELLDQLSSTSVKHQELIDQLSSTSAKQKTIPKRKVKKPKILKKIS